MKYAVTIILVVLVIVGVTTPITSVDAALIENLSPKCANSGTCSVCDMLTVFHNLGRFIFTSAAGVAMLMFLWGASALIFSFGSMEKVAEGKKTMLHTILAIVIILGAWSLVNVLIFFMAGKTNSFDTEQTLTGEMFNGGKWWTGPTCNN